MQKIIKNKWHSCVFVQNPRWQYWLF